MPVRTLTIDLTRRLPDINREESIPGDLNSYGRCAVLNSGTYWFARTSSSHPPTTAEGFYWALAGDVLFLSPRGAAVDWRRWLTPEFIDFLLEKLGIHRRYRNIRVKA